MKSSKKQLMKGYVGVKFIAIRLSDKCPAPEQDLFAAFLRTCNRLRTYNMTPANGGNLSVRHKNDFVISSAGSNLGCIEKNELVLVNKCDLGTKEVCYYGPAKPSSETFMHWLIYKNQPEAKAIIHAHDEPATSSNLLNGKVMESEHEKPYGTIELARMALATFGGSEKIIVLKNHGYVAAGPDLDSTCDLIIETHQRLLAGREN